MAKVRTRTRRLWLNVRYDIPKNISRRRIVGTLIRSIHDGSYMLPRGWRVVIEWRNSESGEMHRGEWRSELEASANGPSGSQGFELAVEEYLRRKIE